MLTFIDPVCFYGYPLMDYSKYENKFSKNIRSQLYRLYFALDFECFTNKLTERPKYAKVLSRILKWFQGRSLLGRSLLINSLLHGHPSEGYEAYAHYSVGILYFGCFNPFHRNHLRLIPRAKELLVRNGCVTSPKNIIGLYCPAPDVYVRIKTGPFVSWQKRVDLLLNTRSSQIFTYVENHEITLSFLKGAAMLVTVKQWFVVLGSDIRKACQMIPSSYGLIIIKRNGFAVEVSSVERRKGPILFDLVDEEKTLSSTELRLQIALNKAIIPT